MKLPCIVIRRGKTGRRLWRFNVIVANNEIIATSEHYNTRRAALKGAHALIAVCKRMFENPDGAIVDLAP